jgi:hypothetical protein
MRMRGINISLEVRHAGRKNVLQHQLHAILCWDRFVRSFSVCQCFTVSLGVLKFVERCWLWGE